MRADSSTMITVASVTGWASSSAVKPVRLCSIWSVLIRPCVTYPRRTGSVTCARHTKSAASPIVCRMLKRVACCAGRNIWASIGPAASIGSCPGEYLLSPSRASVCTTRPRSNSKSFCPVWTRSNARRRSVVN
uniref:Uncharacterized protein n=1 Tax=Cacopsylla melanoneura TaxID=428564 RepID=A0A8D9EHB7_9HEMI